MKPLINKLFKRLINGLINKLVKKVKINKGSKN